MTISKILCPFDVMDDGDRRVLEYAVALAAPFGASVHALHVFDVPGYVHPDRDSSVARSYSERALREHRERLDALLESFGDADVEAELLPGVPHRRIVEEVERLGADLVVMGTHGRAGVSRMVLGSVAERVVRTSPAGVITVPRDTTDVPGAPRSILVPHDFSGASRRGLVVARGLRPPLHASIAVLHVLEGDVDDEGGWAPRWLGIEDRDRLRSLTEKALAEDVSDVFGPDDQAVRVELDYGDVVERVLSYRAELGSELLVVGRTGKSLTEQFLLGSFTISLLRRSPVPVLTVPPG